MKPGEATDFSLRHRDREKVTSELDGPRREEENGCSREK